MIDRCSSMVPVKCRGKVCWSALNLRLNFRSRSPHALKQMRQLPESVAVGSGEMRSCVRGEVHGVIGWLVGISLS